MAVSSNLRCEVTPSEISALHTRMDGIEKAITSLLLEFKALKLKGNRSRSFSRNRSLPRSPVQDGLCFYHRKFGIQARKCDDPCNYDKQKQENSSRCQQ